jgi:hypothetical protein
MELRCWSSAGFRQSLKNPRLIYHQSLGLNFPKLFINNKLATFLFFSSSLLTKNDTKKEHTRYVLWERGEGKVL